MRIKLSALLGFVLAIAFVFAQDVPLLAPPGLPVVGTLPATCAVGQLIQKSGASAGPYVCSATNTWSAVGGASSVSVTSVTGALANTLPCNNTGSTANLINCTPGQALALIGAAPAVLTVNNQSGTAYSVQSADCTTNTVIVTSNSAPVTITIPTSLPAGCQVAVNQSGTGTVSIVGGGGVTLNLLGGLMSTSGQYASALIWQLATNTYVLGGSLQ